MTYPTLMTHPISIEATVAEQLVHDLVAIPSYSREEQPAVTFLVDWFTQHGYTQAFVDAAGNAVGIVGEGDGSEDVILLGHIDTFPGKPTVKIEGRNLYGRGSVDAKSPLCTFAVATLQAKHLLQPNQRLIVVGAVEEECATSKGAHYVATQYQPQVCIIGEPSHWDRMTLGYKGRLMLQWYWEGALAHSAGEQPTAAERAFAYWDRVQAYVATFNSERTSIFGRLDASIRDLNTGTLHGGTHQWARMAIGFRLPPDLHPSQVEAVLHDRHAQLTSSSHELTYVAEKDNVLTRAFRSAIRQHEGTPRFVYKTGTSDMNVVGPVWNCPIVAYGPGDAALDHTPDEHLDLDEYHQAIQVLTNTLALLLEN